MIGQNNHDCGPCPGTLMGCSPHSTMDPNWQEDHARTTSDELPEERVFDILCTNSISHSIENRPPCGMDHCTLHKAPVGNSGCHLPEQYENMRHRSTANLKPWSTVATLETTPCVGGGPTRQQHNNDKFSGGLGKPLGRTKELVPRLVSWPVTSTECPWKRAAAWKTGDSANSRNGCTQNGHLAPQALKD